MVIKSFNQLVFIVYKLLWAANSTTQNNTSILYTAQSIFLVHTYLSPTLGSPADYNLSGMSDMSHYHETHKYTYK